jgi:carboxyl-terminal processing protease
MFGSDIAYVHLSQFQKSAGTDLEAEIDELLADHDLDGLILDLRDNPGGLLEEAVAVSDLFLDEGLIVTTNGRAEGSVAFEATPGGVPPSLSVVVLVNGLSASASEIVAGALQDTGRAVLVGEPTYGKGSVQTLYTYPDDSAIKLTIGHYFTPSGKPVAERRGRVPDHVVALGSESPKVQLEKRLSTLMIGDTERAELLDLLGQLEESDHPPVLVPWDLHGTKRLAADPPVAFAVELLRDEK